MNGSHYIDVVVFGMIAVFIGLRLRSVLGRRTGNERPPQSLGPANGSVTPLRPNSDVRAAGPVIDATPLPAGAPLGATLNRIAALDANAAPATFLAGARAAFEMILKAFARGDETALQPLLSDEVFHNFGAVIGTRRSSGETCENQVVSVDSADVAEAELTGSTARITVRFVSHQIIVVKNAQGAVVEGDPAKTVQATDLWTFARDLRSRDPNWTLVATRSQDE